jgi:hypothetical protein
MSRWQRALVLGAAAGIGFPAGASAGTVTCIDQSSCTSSAESVELLNSIAQGSLLASSTAPGGDATLINHGDVATDVWAMTLSGDSLLINYGEVGGDLFAGASDISAHSDGTATIINYGHVIGSQAMAATYGGYAATLTNYGIIDQFAYAQANYGGDATLTNYGTVKISARASVTGSGNALLTNHGDIAGYAYAGVTIDGNATIVNYGNLGANAFAEVTGSGDALLANHGVIGTYVTVRTDVSGAAALLNDGTILGDASAYTFGAGDATLTNYGSIGGAAAAQALGSGNALLTNYGTISDHAYVSSYASGAGTASAVNNGTMYSIQVYAANGQASLVNKGKITGYAAVFSDHGAASLTNYGTIGTQLGFTAVQFHPGSAATLTSYLGSRIIGTIDLNPLDPGPAKYVNFRGGNWDFTIAHLSGAQIDTAGAPYIVDGDRIVVVDPSAFAAEQAALGGVVNAVGGIVAGRLGTGASAGAGGGGADLALPGAVEPHGGWNFWAEGFAGRANQAADGAIVASQNPFGGGALGFDANAGDFRFGLYGGGAAVTAGNAEAQTVDTAYGFGGAYGRYAFGRAFVALNVFGGWGSSDSSRVIANNTLPTGEETASASYDSRFVSPEITVGMDVDGANGVVLTPAAKLRYLADWSDGYAETGSSSNMNVGDRFSDAFEGRIEIAARKTVAMAAGNVTFRGHAGLVATTGDAGTVDATLIGQNLAFDVPGGNATGGFFGGAGIGYAVNAALDLYSGFEGTGWFDGGSEISARAGLRMWF